MIRPFVLIFLIFISLSGFSQNIGNTLIQNYSSKEYAASISNLGLAQDSRGIIYIANYRGVLTYDGSTWKLTKIGSNLVALSIAVDNQDRIYVGSQGDFGYLSPNKSGELVYTSLKNLLTPEHHIGDIRRIITTSSCTYFISSSNIYELKDTKLQIIGEALKGEYKYLSFYKVKKNIWGINTDMGLININHCTLTKSINGKYFRDKNISYIAEDKSKNSLLLVSENNDYFIYNIVSGEIKAVSNDNSSSQIYTGLKADNAKAHILGSFQNGLIVLDENMSLITKIEGVSSINNELIRDILYDETSGLWLATQQGIAKVEFPSPWSFWDSQKHFNGIPWDFIKYKNNYYLGTTKGLYIIQKNEMASLEGIDNVWDLHAHSFDELDQKLFAGNRNGLYEVKEDHAIKILALPNITSLFSLHNKKLAIGYKSGIVILNKRDEKYVIEKKIDISSNIVFNDISEDKEGNLWGSVKFEGLYKINLSTLEYKLFNRKNGLTDINELKFLKHENRLYCATGKGLFEIKKINQHQTVFVRDSILFKNNISMNKIARTGVDEFVVSILSDDGAAQLEKLSINSKKSNQSIPFNKLHKVQVSFLYPDDTGLLWIGGSEKLYVYNKNIKKDYDLSFNTLIRQVTIKDSIIFHGNYSIASDTALALSIVLTQPDDFKPVLKYKENNIIFEYASTYYEASDRTIYSYYLENNDTGWSKWTSDHKKEYSNLSAGTYTFHVKAKNIYDTEGSIASYQFTILPPWYQTFWAYIFFIVIGFLFIWFVALIYSYRVRMQRRRLKLIVADRTYEVINQKKEIERQRDLLQHQYEEICNQRDSIQQKNRKLQAAQNETIYANEALQKLNTHLEKEVEKRTEKIKQTLQQLQNKNKELDTFIYRASHDLKGPISRISGLSTLAKMAVPPDADKSFVELIEVTANNMKVLISKLTQVHDLNNAQIKSERVNIADLLISIRNTLNHLEDENINYTFHFSEGLEVIGDKDLIGIIIQNILENALVFKKPRGLQNNILIEIGSTKESLTVRIYDTGIGMLPEQMDRIYDMFYKGTNQSIGSGLGLYLVKMTVEKLNGSISVRSKVHEFTEFTVTIPL